MNFKKILLEIFIILFLSIGIGLIYNEARDKPLDLIGVFDEKTESLLDAYDEKTITADELYYYITNGEAIIFDARDNEYYKEGHIPFAISLPIREFDIIFKTVKGILNQTKTIIIYCSGVDCKDSTDLAKKLYKLNYKNIFVYKGGIIEWKDELQNRIEMED